MFLQHFDLKMMREMNRKKRGSLKSSDYYWPEPKPVALLATGQVSTLTEQG